MRGEHFGAWSGVCAAAMSFICGGGIQVRTLRDDSADATEAMNLLVADC